MEAYKGGSEFPIEFPETCAYASAHVSREDLVCSFNRKDSNPITSSMEC